MPEALVNLARVITMGEQKGAINDDTLALAHTVSVTLDRQKRCLRGTEPGALLVVATECTDMPSELIEDTVLDPIDKVIWLLLLTSALRVGGVTNLPTHTELARNANVAARQTVSGSLSILRCRRWLTVCRSTWRKGGELRGSAYALHARPLPIADTIYLDPQFPAIIQKLTGQYDARVRNVACDVLRQLQKSSN